MATLPELRWDVRTRSWVLGSIFGRFMVHFSVSVMRRLPPAPRSWGGGLKLRSADVTVAYRIARARLKGAGLPGLVRHYYAGPYRRKVRNLFTHVVGQRMNIPELASIARPGRGVCANTFRVDAVGREGSLMVVHLS